MTEEQSSGDGYISPVIGVILMVVVTVVMSAVVGSFVLGLAPDSQMSDVEGAETAPATASAAFEQAETADGNIEVKTTLLSASADAYEVRVSVDTADGSETEVWSKPQSDARYEEHRTVGDNLERGLNPGDTVRILVYDGETIRTVQTYTIADE